MESTAEVIINSATFNPKVKTYIFLVVLFFLVVSFIGLVIVPFWLLGLGQWLSNKYFHTLTCDLSNKTLKFSKGFILHIEKTIPLENIQDLSFSGGPFLRYFGLTMIKVETAGGGHHNSNMMSMLGINDAVQFKNQILDQRERVINEKYSRTSAASTAGADIQLLQEIKNVLIEIKEELKK